MFVKHVTCKAEIIPLVCLADIIIFAFPETTGAVMGDPEWNLTQWRVLCQLIETASKLHCAIRVGCRVVCWL